jgi:hypothetical protein
MYLQIVQIIINNNIKINQFKIIVSNASNVNNQDMYLQIVRIIINNNNNKINKFKIME